MDRFRQHFTSTEKPTSPFHGNKENEFSEEFSNKLKVSDDKRLPVAKNKVSVKRSKTLDVEDQPKLLRSFNFDENLSRFDSSLPPYDPVKNYLSPRPKFLMYNPDRRREILFRQEMVNGVRESALVDDGMLSSEEEEMESSDECYLDASSGDECFVEKVELIDEFISSSDDENVEELEEYSGWSLSVFLQYLFVMIVLILTTMSISSMNSPIVSPARESIRELYHKTRGSVYGVIGVNFSEVGSKPFDSMILVIGKLSPKKIDSGENELDNEDFAVQTDGLVEVQYEQTKHVCVHEVVELETGETQKIVDDTENVSSEEKWINNDSEQFQSSRIIENKEVQVKEIEQYKENSYQIQEPIIPVRKEMDSQEIEAQKDYNQLSGDDSNQNEACVESVFESKIERIQNTDDHIKLVSFYPIYTGTFVLILVATSVLYYSIVVRKRTVMPAMELVNSGEVTSSYMSFGTTRRLYSESQESNFYQSQWMNNMSPTKTESSSSSHKSSSRFGRSTGDSPAHGSFTVDKKIIKKKKSQTPEVIISTVRRSSRINNRSFSSP